MELIDIIEMKESQKHGYRQFVCPFPFPLINRVTHSLVNQPFLPIWDLILLAMHTSRNSSWTQASRDELGLQSFRFPAAWQT